MANETGREHEQLGILVGRWRTTGRTRETADAPALRIEATDTYEWLPGRTALLHTVDARVGEERVEGAEIIGWDSSRGTYVTQYFGTDGPNAYEASLTDEGDAIVWRMRSASDRFTGTFSEDRDTLAGHWERLGPGGDWSPWMEVSLTRQQAG
jgi:Protein of unknown function (DUF1579)